MRVTVTGSKGTQWQGTACRLPIGPCASLDAAYYINPNDSDEHAVTYETIDMIWQHNKQALSKAKE